MTTLLDIKHEKIFYGDFLAVDDVSVQIPARAITALIGPSGCGKSTFLRTLNRMHEAIPGARVEGEVLLEGQDIYAKDVDPVQVRRHVGMVFQRPNPFPTMSIAENVLAGVTLNSRKLKKSDADELVEEQASQRLARPVGIGHTGDVLKTPEWCHEPAVDGNLAGHRLLR